MIRKVIINTDGAAEPNPGAASIGAVIKDEHSRVLATISQSIGHTTNNQAEYRAIIAALQKALELGARQVELRSDSQLIVCQVSGEYRVKTASLRPLFQKVKALQNQFEKFTMSHIDGKTNTEAHNLAHAALK
ncbi:MAG: ribonuclease HI family protein [Chloroflexota bacterium]